MCREARIRAVLFDLGETLLNFGRISTTRLFRVGARTSHAFLKGLDQPVSHFEAYCWTNLIRLRLRTFISSLTGRDFDAFDLLKRVGIRKGIKLSADQWREYAWQWYEPLSRTAEVEPGTIEALGHLRDSGLKLGILSNTFVNRESLDRHMDAMGILEFFSFRTYSYEESNRKPHAEIFRIAGERMGEAFENIMYVGDRIDKDIRPALKIGMRSVLKEAYTNAGKKTPEGALRISRISELPKLIEGINANAGED